MNAHVQTYKQFTAPPSIALTRMAFRLAWSRKTLDGMSPREHDGPAPRQEARWLKLTVSSEHYRILDRITRGERP